MKEAIESFIRDNFDVGFTWHSFETNGNQRINFDLSGSILTIEFNEQTNHIKVIQKRYKYLESDLKKLFKLKEFL